MFFPFRRRNSEDDDDDDEPVDLKKKRTLKSAVKNLQALKSPVSPPSHGKTPGLLSVVTTLTNSISESQDIALSSDMLVKKLFKGMGLPLFKPVVQQHYLAKDVPPAIKDYRWGAYDFPVFHDTMLSIVRPPTPPQEPSPPMLIEDSRAITPVSDTPRMESPTPEESSQAQSSDENARNSVDLMSVRRENALLSSKASQRSRAPTPVLTPASVSTPAAEQGEPTSIVDTALSRKISQKLISGNSSKRPSRESQKASSRGSQKITSAGSRKESRESHLSRKQQHDESNMLVTTPDHLMLDGESESMKNLVQSLAALSVRSRPMTEQAMSAIHELENEEPTPDARNASQIHTRGSEQESKDEMTKSSSALSAKQRVSSRSNKIQESSGGNVDGDRSSIDRPDSHEASIEALLDLHSAESQWNFLKDGKDYPTGLAGATDDPPQSVKKVVGSGPEVEAGDELYAVQKEGEGYTEPPIELEEGSVGIGQMVPELPTPPRSGGQPPPPSSTQPPLSPEAVKTTPEGGNNFNSINSNSNSYGYDAPVSSSSSAVDESNGKGTKNIDIKTTEKAEGKIISPAQRSVFRPTFAAPRPNLDAASASVLTPHAQYLQSLSAEERAAAALEPSVGQLSSPPTKPKKNGFSVLEESFLKDHSPAYHVNNVNYQNMNMYESASSPQFAQYGQVAAEDAPINFAKFKRRKVEEGHSEEKSGEKKRRNKHTSPSKHWYMAGAYSSHSEAMEAIRKLNRLIENSDGESGDDSGESKFRLQRDLSRMQWVVECNDAHNRPVILAHGKASSNEKDKEKYRKIVQSVQEPVFHPNEWDLSPAQDHHKIKGGKLHSQQRRDDKYLRDRDQYHENNLRHIRQHIPSHDKDKNSISPPPRQPRQPHEQKKEEDHHSQHSGEKRVKFPAIAPQHQVKQKKVGKAGGGGKKNKANV